MIKFTEIIENGVTFKRSSLNETWRLVIKDNIILSIIQSDGFTQTINEGYEFDTYEELELYCSNHNIEIIIEDEELE